MPQLSTQAIILHTTDYAEWDKIVSLYTTGFGRIRGIAKGAKRSQKRFGSALEPFTHNEVAFVAKENRGLVRLERCRIVHSFSEIAEDVRKVAFGQYFLELVHTLTAENERSPDIFALLLFFINLLGSSSFRESHIRLFELRLFSLLGYQPQFLQCTDCGRTFSLNERYKFSIKRGGIVCSLCQRTHCDLLPLSNGTIRIFQRAQQLALLKLGRLFFSPSEHEEGKAVFGKFLEYHIGRKPKSLAIIEQLA